MKPKPMLFQKIKANNRGKNREVIGLIGTHHGVGVTHTGLMLAFYMGEELGRKTAFLECNDNHDMNSIQNAYEWSREEALTFSFHQITCYKEVAPNRILEILNEDYDSVIIDFGTDFSSNREEFLRSQTKIVIGGRSEWDLWKLVRFTDASESIHGSDTWLYFIPRADEKTVAKISNEIKRRVWPVPITNEPTMPSRNAYRIFSKIFYI